MTQNDLKLISNTIKIINFLAINTMYVYKKNINNKNHMASKI